VSEASLEAQLRKLQARRPELGLAAVFVPPAQRSLVWQWQALCDEIEEACFELSEPYVAQVKLGWWAEELVRGQAGAGRHPLVQALFEDACARSVDAGTWTAPARAAIELLERELTPADCERASAALVPLAAALDAIERGLFGGAGSQSAIVADLLLRRLLRARAGYHANARLPRNLLARHALAPSQLASGADAQAEQGFLRDYASELRVLAGNSTRGAARPRALETGLLDWRLSRLARGEIPAAGGGFGLTFALWRAARRAAPWLEPGPG
jgi:phytoene synthase